MTTQDVGLGIFVESGSSKTRTWLFSGNQPDPIPPKPHIPQPPTLEGPLPTFDLPMIPATFREPSSSNDAQQMWRGGQRMLVGLGLTGVNTVANSITLKSVRATTVTAEI